MFYRIDEYGNIIDKGNFKYSDDCLETTENIVNHFNGKLIFEKESLTDTYLESLNEYNNKLSTDKIVSELTNWFETFFRTQLEQHSWQKDYKPSADPYFKNEDGNPKTYETFEDIIVQAEIAREEIKKLRS